MKDIGATMEELLHRFNPWWTEDFHTEAIPRQRYQRQLMSLVDTRDVVLVTGLRRVGKTTLLYLTIEKLLEKVPADRIFYVSLDHMGLRDHTILDIVEEYRRINRLKHDEHAYLFLDEVHLKEEFELQLKNLYDEGNTKVFASGSASLEITMRSPHLTGRQRLVPVHPLDFMEFLAFSEVEVSPADGHLLAELAEDHVKYGGIPEYVRTRDMSYLQSVVDTILWRDVAGRHEIRNREMLADMLALVAQGVGAPLSTRKISRVLGVSTETVSRTLDLFSEANLIHQIERQGKVSERKASPKKIYLADTGLFSILTEGVNLGSMAENAVYLALMRTGRVRYNLASGREVDFISRDTAWESKYKTRIAEKDLVNIKALKRPTKKVVITRDAEGSEDGIQLLPLWRFLTQEAEGKGG